MPLDGDAPSLRYPSLRQAIAFAGFLDILDQDTAQLREFRLTEGQCEVLALALVHRRLIILKGRQVGISTVLCLLDLLVAMMNEGITVLVMAHTHDATMELMGKVKAWVEALGVPCLRQTEKLIGLANGSRIIGRTARTPGGVGRGVSTAGRASSFHHIHLSEAAFFANDDATIAALLSTTSSVTGVVVESTASPALNWFQKRWRRIDAEEKPLPPDEWCRSWQSTEKHENYRADPTLLSDETWESARKLWHFTNRAFASWWLRKLANDIIDVHQMQREYPVVETQAFAYAEGRWLLKYTLAPVRAQEQWRWYPDLNAYDDPLVLGVDFGTGCGGDYSFMVLLGQRTGRIHATWHSNTLDLDSFTDLVTATARRMRVIAVAAEGNGVGKGPVAKMRKVAGLKLFEHVSEHSEKLMRFRHLKVAVESGATPIGDELALETRSSVVDREGVYTGRDDGLNALSFAQAWRRAHPHHSAPPPELERRDRFNPAKRGRKRRAGMGGV